MKKIAIVGAGNEQVPAIKMAKEFGLYVIVTDIAPDAPGIKYADKFYKISTDDPQGTLEMAKKENIDGITTLCSETAVPVIARVATELGLPGMNDFTAEAATNKGVMREQMDRFNVPVSDYRVIETLKELTAFTGKYPPPWIIKPSNSSGQRGITVLKDMKEAENAIQDAKSYSSDGKVIVEEYLQGPEINITTLAIDGNINILSLSERITLDHPYFGIAVMHLAPAQLNNSQVEKINTLAVNATKAIGLENGVSYPQVINTANGPKLLEIAARIPGGHMREVAMYLSGVDMIKTNIRQALGEKFKFKDAETDKSYPALAVKFITALDIHLQKDVVSHISGIEDAAMMPGIELCYVRLQKGKKVPPLTNSSGRFGAIIAVGNNRDEVVENVNKAFQKIKIF